LGGAGEDADPEPGDVESNCRRSGQEASEGTVCVPELVVTNPVCRIDGNGDRGRGTGRVHLSGSLIPWCHVSPEPVGRVGSLQNQSGPFIHGRPSGTTRDGRGSGRRHKPCPGPCPVAAPSIRRRSWPISDLPPYLVDHCADNDAAADPARRPSTSRSAAKEVWERGEDSRHPPSASLVCLSFRIQAARVVPPRFPIPDGTKMG
jgi:hypothetical protein